MKRELYLIGVLLLWVTGCNTINQAQYKIAGAPTEDSMRATISLGDREDVKSILRSVAVQFDWRDYSKSSLVPETLAYYIQTETDSPTRLVAWVSGDSIVVDLMQPAGGGGETLNYRQAREMLWHRLQDRFGDRVRLVPYRERITPSSR